MTTKIILPPPRAIYERIKRVSEQESLVPFYKQVSENIKADDDGTIVGKNFVEQWFSNLNQVFGKNEELWTKVYENTYLYIRILFWHQNRMFSTHIESIVLNTPVEELRSYGTGIVEDTPVEDTPVEDTPVEEPLVVDMAVEPVENNSATVDMAIEDTSHIPTEEEILGMSWNALRGHIRDFGIELSEGSSLKTELQEDVLKHYGYKD